MVRRRRDQPLVPNEVWLLLVASHLGASNPDLPGWFHGYDLVQAMRRHAEQLGTRPVSAATVYRVIQRMADLGALEHREESRPTPPGGRKAPPRQYYRLTATGRLLMAEGQRAYERDNRPRWAQGFDEAIS